MVTSKTRWVRAAVVRCFISARFLSTTTTVSKGAEVVPGTLLFSEGSLPDISDKRSAVWCLGNLPILRNKDRDLKNNRTPPVCEHDDLNVLVTILFPTDRALPLLSKYSSRTSYTFADAYRRARSSVCQDKDKGHLILNGLFFLSCEAPHLSTQTPDFQKTCAVE